MKKKEKKLNRGGNSKPSPKPSKKPAAKRASKPISPPFTPPCADVELVGQSDNGEVCVHFWTGFGKRGRTHTKAGQFDSMDDARYAVERALPGVMFTGEEVSEHGYEYDEFYIDGEPGGFIEGEKVEDGIYDDEVEQEWLGMPTF